MLFFRYSGWKRLALFAFGNIIFPVNMTVTFWPTLVFASTFLAFIYILAHIRESGVGPHFLSLNLKISVLIFSLAIFITCQLDPRLAIMNKFTRPLVVSLSYFLAFPFLWRDASRPIDPKLIGRFLLSTMIFMFTYSIITEILGNNPYHLYISTFSPAPDVANLYMGTNERFRISSFFGHPMDYGLICAYWMLLAFQVYELKSSSKWVLAFIVIISGISVGMANSRLPMLIWFLAISAAFFFGRVWKTPAVVKLTSGAILLVTALTVGSGNIVGQTLLMFNDTEAVAGSSLSMRITQLEASTRLALDEPFFGHGLGYIVETMGFNPEEKDGAVEEDFAGFESILFAIPIEQGYVGLFALFLIYIEVIFLISKQPSFTPHFYAFTVLGLFILYQIGTGMLGTGPLSMVSIIVSTRLLSPSSELKPS